VPLPMEGLAQLSDIACLPQKLESIHFRQDITTDLGRFTTFNPAGEREDNILV
jgi:hypothetical protein